MRKINMLMVSLFRNLCVFLLIWLVSSNSLPSYAFRKAYSQNLIEKVADLEISASELESAPFLIPVDAGKIFIFSKCGSIQEYDVIKNSSRVVLKSIVEPGETIEAVSKINSDDILLISYNRDTHQNKTRTFNPYQETLTEVGNLN